MMTTNKGVVFNGETNSDSRATDIMLNQPLSYDWDYILEELAKEEHTDLLHHLKQGVAPLHRLTDIIDDKGFNLLHHAVLKGMPGKFGILIDLYNQGIYDEEPDITKHRKLQWLNARTDGDRFSPMHFASFKGNVNAVEELLKQGG